MANLVYCYLPLNRLQDVRATVAAQAKKLESPELHVLIYYISFLQDDAPGMAQQVAWSKDKTGVEDILLYLEADTAAYFGQLGKARQFSLRAVESAERGNEKETAAGYEAEAALREALFGNLAEARKRASAALGLSTGRDIRYATAIALAVAGDSRQSQRNADDFNKNFPEGTTVQFNYLPTIRALLALNHNDFPKALEALQTAAPYELGTPAFAAFSPVLYPVYVRGQAYLAGHQGAEAAAEFQKILDHRGIVINQPIGALAHLQMGRAYALLADKAKARAAYKDFLTLWKDADPDIPILKEAKAEYAKLHRLRKVWSQDDRNGANLKLLLGFEKEAEGRPDVERDQLLMSGWPYRPKGKRKLTVGTLIPGQPLDDDEKTTVAGLPPGKPIVDGVTGAIHWKFGCALQQAVYELMQQRWRAMVCAECKKFFLADKTRQVYCKPACSGEARRKRALDYWNRKGSAERDKRKAKAAAAGQQV